MFLEKSVVGPKLSVNIERKLWPISPPLPLVPWPFLLSHFFMQFKNQSGLYYAVHIIYQSILLITLRYLIFNVTKIQRLDRQERFMSMNVYWKLVNMYAYVLWV